MLKGISERDMGLMIVRCQRILHSKHDHSLVSEDRVLRVLCSDGFRLQYNGWVSGVI